MQIKLRGYLLLFAFLLYLIEMFFNFNATTQISFLIFILILFGVPHGALDLYIDQHLQKSDAQSKVFLIKYIANIVAYGLVWYYFPILALVIFILITAYHFGEIDWMGKSTSILHKIVYSLFGFAWILFLLTKNIHFALDVFLTMGRAGFSKSSLIQLAQTIYPYTLCLICGLYIILFFFKDFFFDKPVYFYTSLLQTILLIFFLLYMPLWLSFAFYFGFWHSLLSFDK
ncbi:MAG: hypothetical protein RL377_1730, partial [Bacteroidota bacterium]